MGWTKTKKCPSEILSSIKWHLLNVFLFLAAVFDHFLMWLKTSEARYRRRQYTTRTVYALLTGGLWTMADDDDTGVATLYAAEPQHPCTEHHGEATHEYNLGRYRVCWGCPAGAALPKQIWDNRNSFNLFLSGYEPQATRAPWERELLAGPATRLSLRSIPGGSALRSLSSGSW